MHSFTQTHPAALSLVLGVVFAPLGILEMSGPEHTISAEHSHEVRQQMPQMTSV